MLLRKTGIGKAYGAKKSLTPPVTQLSKELPAACGISLCPPGHITRLSAESLENANFSFGRNCIQKYREAVIISKNYKIVGEINGYNG